MVDYNQLKSEVNSQLDILWGYIVSDPKSLTLYSDQEYLVIPDQVKILIWQIMLKCRNLIFEYIFQPKNYPKYIYERFLSNNKNFSYLPKHISQMILHQTHSYIAEILKKLHLEWTRDEEFSGSPLFPPDMLVELYPKFISFFAQHEREIQIHLGLKDQKSLKDYHEFCFVGFSIIMDPTPHLEPYEIEDRENDVELEDIQNEKVAFATIPESKKEFVLNLYQIIKFLIKIVIIVLIYIASPLNPSQLAITSFVGVLIGGTCTGIIHWKLQPQQNMTQRIVTAFNWMWLMTILTYSIALLII